MMVATSCNSTTSNSENAPAKEAANPVIETILSRRSIRTYKDQPVSRELLQQIAECGISAPNGMNAQQWEVRIVDSKEWIDGATAAYKGFSDPVAVEEIKADAGLDIGSTLIGMHIKKVAVPVRLKLKRIGEAPLTAARSRPKFIGGERAHYDEKLK